MMDLHRFLNALRILRSIEHWELHYVGVIGTIWAASDSEWDLFRDNPFDFLLRCDDARAARLWAIVEARQPKPVTPELPATPIMEA